ncbi:MAG: hypothetical protein ABWY26_01915 [Microbacterium sp.]
MSFPDPDDVLDTGYLQAIREFIGSADDAESVPMLAVRNVEFSTDASQTADVHPLRYRFQRGTRVYDLADTPPQYPYERQHGVLPTRNDSAGESHIPCRVPELRRRVVRGTLPVLFLIAPDRSAA